MLCFLVKFKKPYYAKGIAVVESWSSMIFLDLIYLLKDIENYGRYKCIEIDFIQLKYVECHYIYGVLSYITFQ